ncbi:hypothetical protein Ppro_2435 [Pelobacter propionicus DSM 2379]|uniref:Uncharacterized protein n=1 Tax=Pelobacter propionicus (strain DSM 2379 / NBRC 103807 / OttBd1) TaxID=338966 RepID=A1ARS0_PELPD|nr:hypothetical protein Ppro_2435 [Pelobacter propionicus DSM 2379]
MLLCWWFIELNFAYTMQPRCQNHITPSLQHVIQFDRLQTQPPVKIFNIKNNPARYPTSNQDGQETARGFGDRQAMKFTP